MICTRFGKRSCDTRYFEIHYRQQVLIFDHSKEYSSARTFLAKQEVCVIIAGLKEFQGRCGPN